MICEASVVEVVDDVVGAEWTVVDVDGGGAEIEVRCPVNEIEQDGLFPASRLARPVPITSLPPRLTVTVMLSMMSFAG